MESQINVKSQNWRVHITVGVSLTVIIIFLAVWFATTVKIILLAISGVAAFAGLVATGHYAAKWKLTRREMKQLIAIQRQQLRQEQYKADRLEMERYIFTSDARQRVIMPGWYRDVNIIQPVLASRQLPASASTIDAPGAQPMLDALRHSDSVIFLGAKQTGKTNGAMHWVASRPGRVVVLDVKSHNLWPQNCRVVNEIGKFGEAIKMVKTEGERRRENGIITAVPVTLFIDELHYVRRQGVDVIDEMLDITTLYAEYKIFTAFTSHANTGKYLGIDAVGLLDNYDAVYTTKTGDNYQMAIDNGSGKQPATPPGKFAAAVAKNRQLFLSRDDRIRQMINAGKSNHAICHAVFSGKNKRRYSEINAIRASVR